ncbi:ASTRA-associated protein 1, partial [Durusdinium trenchii]
QAKSNRSATDLGCNCCGMNPAPATILRSRGGAIYSVCFASPEQLLSGSLAGEVSLWDLQDQRPAWTWKASTQTVLSVQCFEGCCLSQGKDGRVKLWDMQSQELQWEVSTGSCSFCRVLPLDTSGTFSFCSPLSEPEELGIFDARAPQPQIGHLVLPRADGTSSPGMCMDLCHCPALGSFVILATYESADLALWDVRMPRQPSSYLAGDPTCPAICSAVLWRKVWLSCAGGQLKMLRLRDGIELSSSKVQAAEAPYHQPANEIKYMAEKRGINALAVRPDLRLVAAARSIRLNPLQAHWVEAGIAVLSSLTERLPSPSTAWYVTMTQCFLLHLNARKAASQLVEPMGALQFGASSVKAT